MDVVLDAYMSASRAVFILQVPLIGLCLLGCVLIKDRGLQRPEDVKVEQGTTVQLGNAVLVAGVTKAESEKLVAAQAHHQNPV